VGELVEDRREQARFAPAEHGVENRIGQVTERRVSRHAAHADVVALRREACGTCARVVRLEEAEIRDAAGDGEAPAPRLDREFGGRDHAPDRVRTAEIRIALEALAVRQAELPDREPARLDHQLQSRARFRRRRWIGRRVVDRAAARQHIELPARCLQQVAAAERQADREDC